jgi:hypothetical protein
VNCKECNHEIDYDQECLNCMYSSGKLTQAMPVADAYRCPRCGTVYAQGASCIMCTDIMLDKLKATQRGRKDDAEKTPWGDYFELLPLNALAYVGKVFLYGAKKYGKHNYMEVADGLRRYRNAGFRHMLSDTRGEEIDPESGFLHTGLAIASLLIKLEKQLKGDK